uniref:Uncharacterized protein n=1 Tax=Utricularia reniformis TaxID=192314 RepID=A0A1Y0B3P8_9LAMI|nr:hypothetical protein AEK19_MT0849 [Utricularia reniformis]YP_009382288.1 hypothetical protein AEK19_MT1860 [Utricularia reniformis]ART31080.1 hypothetical protein AEK19_MT0849 [Utricularia reniformis]ART32031.1 hypothetical protein AEK19_MT1860 [Utricularia reniformis]
MRVKDSLFLHFLKGAWVSNFPAGVITTRIPSTLILSEHLFFFLPPKLVRLNLELKVVYRLPED